jgi:type VI secretion system protein ImpC
MSNRFDFGGVNLRASDQPASARPTSETPFCIAILGDFSGRENRAICEPSTVGERRVWQVDRDNFDEVLSNLHPELQFPTESGVPLIFRFTELEDFHPDRLFNHEAFQKLKSLREQVQDPSTFKGIAGRTGILPAPINDPVRESARVTAPDSARLASGSLLDEMIEETESRVPLEPPPRINEVKEFARQLAAKYAVSAPDVRQPEVIASVDRAIGDTMRTILHHPDFQALEAIWRAAFLLVRRLETGSQLKIFLLDISKQELAADLRPSEDLRETGIFRQIIDKTVETPGADPFTIVVGAFRFGSTIEELQLLAKLARVADGGGAVLLAEADSLLLGCSSIEESPSPRDWKRPESQSVWETLRSQPESASIGLALPRFLLRLPYGKETSRLDYFDFEECNGSPNHDDYLWGNPAFVVALMVGQSFEDSGWKMQLGHRSQVENLPLHTYRVEGDLRAKPCAEVLLTEEAVERVLEQGLIPLVSYKGRDEVRVGRFQSIAESPGLLKGRWNA